MSAYKRLHYSLFDILIILSGISCIVVGAMWFQKAGDTISFSIEQEQFGTISTGDGTRKLNNSLQWFQVSKSNDLFYGDVIFANENKDIEVELLDKQSKLVIPEDSMIKITKAGDDFNLDVSKGSILIKTKKTKKFNLRDKRGKVRKISIAKDSDIKISTKKSNVTVEAIKGEAELIKVNPSIPKAKPEKIKIVKDKILIVGRKKTEVMKKENIMGLKVIDPLFKALVPLTSKFKNLSYLEVSKSSSFEVSKKVPIKNALMDISKLGYGQYFVKASGEDKIDNFELTRIKPMRISFSKQDSYFIGDVLKIKWNARSDLNYKVEILNDNNKSSKVIRGNGILYRIKNDDDIRIKVTQERLKRESKKILTYQVSELLSIENIEKVQVGRNVYRNLIMKNPRQITYRVQVKDKEGKTLINKRGRKNQFLMRIDRPGAYDLKVLNEKDKRELVDSNFVIKDRITNVGKNKVIYSTSKELKANLKWKRGGNIPKDMEYVIKIYKSGNKKDPYIEKKTKKTNYVYKTDKEEKFFWKIESTIPELIDSSALFETKLSRPKFPKLFTPRIILKYIDSKECYFFKLPKYKYIRQYDVYIFNSRSKVNQNRKAMYHEVISKNSDCLSKKDLLVFEGKYYYKYKVIDRWQRKSSHSPVGEMFFPISPLESL